MAKIDQTLASIEAGFQKPLITTGTTLIPDDQMEMLQVRRKKAGETHHRLWYLAVGETGQNPTATFWGHKFSDCITKALAWRGLATKSNRGPRAKQDAAA